VAGWLWGTALAIRSRAALFRRLTAVHNNRLTATTAASMSRRLFLILSLGVPALLRTIADARPEGAVQRSRLLLVDGWLLRETDLLGSRDDL